MYICSLRIRADFFCRCFILINKTRNNKTRNMMIITDYHSEQTTPPFLA
jgi:hypothetical protein